MGVLVGTLHYISPHGRGEIRDITMVKIRRVGVKRYFIVREALTTRHHYGEKSEGAVKFTGSGIFFA